MDLYSRINLIASILYYGSYYLKYTKNDCERRLMSIITKKYDKRNISALGRRTVISFGIRRRENYAFVVISLIGLILLVLRVHVTKCTATNKYNNLEISTVLKKRFFFFLVPLRKIKNKSFFFSKLTTCLNILYRTRT